MRAGVRSSEIGFTLAAQRRTAAGMRRFLLLPFLLLALLGTPASAAPAGPLVLAAASMQEAMTDAADAWARHGHSRPTISFAASSALARQVEAGARADLFVSADEDWMDALQQRGLVWPGTRVTFAGNRLVVVAPRGDAVQVALRPGVRLDRVLGPDGRLAMADPAAVPAGKYGKAALERLGGWAPVANRIVAGESVRAALALVERGAARLGIVYRTDALASPRVRIAGVFPAASHPPIRYPLARLKGSTNPDAEAFRRFLLGPEARAILARHGFATR